MSAQLIKPSRSVLCLARLGVMAPSPGRAKAATEDGASRMAGCRVALVADNRRADVHGKESGMIAAIFGFAGVILGSLTTSVLTIYRERLASQRESTVREQQYQRERKALRDTFQRESILAVQSAVTALIGAAYAELDRLHFSALNARELASLTPRYVCLRMDCVRF